MGKTHAKGQRKRRQRLHEDAAALAEYKLNDRVRNFKWRSGLSGPELSVVKRQLRNGDMTFLLQIQFTKHKQLFPRQHKADGALPQNPERKKAVVTRLAKR